MRFASNSFVDEALSDIAAGLLCVVALFVYRKVNRLEIDRDDAKTLFMMIWPFTFGALAMLVIRKIIGC